MDNATSKYVFGVAHAPGNGQFPRSRLLDRVDHPMLGFLGDHLSLVEADSSITHHGNAEAAAIDQRGIFPIYVSAPESKP